MLSFDHITMGEIATIEKLADLPIQRIQAQDAPKGRGLAAMALVAKRRTGHPEFSWADAQELTLVECNDVLDFYRPDDEPDEDAGDASVEDEGLGHPAAEGDPDVATLESLGGPGNVEAAPTAPAPPAID